MARLALGEALTNLVWAAASGLADVKASVNWMYAAKMGGEGAAMYDAAAALRDAMLALGLACDGGKDSLSMAAACGADATPTSPSAVTRPDFLAAADRPFLRSQSIACSTSPPVWPSAFLQSIMPAPVFSRRSFTRAAVISAISIIS